jgi:hypothetical protein
MEVPIFFPYELIKKSLRDFDKTVHSESWQRWYAVYLVTQHPEFPFLERGEIPDMSTQVTRILAGVDKREAWSKMAPFVMKLLNPEEPHVSPPYKLDTVRNMEEKLGFELPNELIFYLTLVSRCLVVIPEPVNVHVFDHPELGNVLMFGKDSEGKNLMLTRPSRREP